MGTQISSKRWLPNWDEVFSRHGERLFSVVGQVIDGVHNQVVLAVLAKTIGSVASNVKDRSNIKPLIDNLAKEARRTAFAIYDMKAKDEKAGIPPGPRRVWMPGDGAPR